MTVLPIVRVGRSRFLNPQTAGAGFRQAPNSSRTFSTGNPTHVTVRAGDFPATTRSPVFLNRISAALSSGFTSARYSLICLAVSRTWNVTSVHLGEDSLPMFAAVATDTRPYHGVRATGQLFQHCESVFEICRFAELFRLRVQIDDRVRSQHESIGKFSSRRRAPCG